MLDWEESGEARALVRHERTSWPQGQGCNNCTTDEGKAPRDRLAEAGLKSPSAAMAKSHGREHRRKRSGERPDQMSDKKMNASEPLKTCRKSLRLGQNQRSEALLGKSMGGVCLLPIAAHGIEVA